MSEARCRFVQIADVHYVAGGEAELSPAQVAARLGEQRRATHLAETMLPWALGQICEGLRPDFIIFTGDQVDVGWDEEGLANHTAFQRLVGDVVGPELPVHYAFGNHDRPRERFVELYGDSVYRIESNGCHLAVLDSGVMNTDQGVDPPKVFEAGLEHLRAMLQEADEQPAAVLLHFWVYPPDVVGYSYPRADEVIRMLQEFNRPVPVLSGHYHYGRLDVIDSIPYFTARSFIESPYAFYLHELSRQRLIVYEYQLDPRQGCWRGWPRCRFDLQ